MNGSWYLVYDVLVGDRGGPVEQPCKIKLAAMAADAAWPAFAQALCQWEKVLQKEHAEYEERKKKWVGALKPILPFGGKEPNPRLVFEMPIAIPES